MAGAKQDSDGRWVSEDGFYIWDGAQWQPRAAQGSAGVPVQVAGSSENAAGSAAAATAIAPVPQQAAAPQAPHAPAPLAPQVAISSQPVPISAAGRAHLEESAKKSVLVAALLNGVATYLVVVAIGFRVWFVFGLLALVWCSPLIVLLFPVFVVQRIRYKGKLKRDLAAGQARREPLTNIVLTKGGSPSALVLGGRQVSVRDDDGSMLRQLLGDDPTRFDGGAVDVAPESGLLVGVRDRSGRIAL